MTKIKLHFTLTGKTDQWKRYIRGEQSFSNNDNVEYVRDLVVGQFGKRPLFITNESTLRSDIVVYPKYYSAGWFISDDSPLAELVVVAHGESMAAANKSMMETVTKIDWDRQAKGVM